MDIKYENKINSTVKAIANFLIDDRMSDSETPFKECIKIDKLDYSLKSLNLLDGYLSKVRKKLQLLTDDEYTKIILRCGAYTGEVIKRNSKIQFDWMLYDDLIESVHQLSEFNKSPLTYYILTHDQGNSLTFPMAKVEKFLRNGSEDSLYSYAVVIGKFE